MFSIFKHLIIFIFFLILASCSFFGVDTDEPKYNSKDLVERFRYNQKKMQEKQEERFKNLYMPKGDSDSNYKPPMGFYDPSADNPVYPEYYPLGETQIYYHPNNGNKIIRQTIETYNPYPQDNDSYYTLPNSYRYPNPQADNPINPETEFLFDN